MNTRRLFQALLILGTLAVNSIVVQSEASDIQSDIQLKIGNRYEFPDGDWAAVLNHDFSYGFTFQLETPDGEVIDARRVSLQGSKLFSIAQGGSYHAQPLAFVIPAERIAHTGEAEKTIFYVHETVSEGVAEAWKLSPPLIVMVDREGRTTLSSDTFAHQFLGLPQTKAADTVEKSLVTLDPAERPLGVPARSSKSKRDAVLVFALILVAIVVVAVRIMLLLSQRDRKMRRKKR
jgi:hypothetical protein